MTIRKVLQGEEGKQKFQQPAGSNMCGAYALAMALKALDCDFSCDIPIPNEGGLFFGRQSVIRSGDNFHGVAGAIYQVTGNIAIEDPHVPASILRPGVCALNGPAGMIAVAIGAGLPRNRMTIRYTDDALAMFNELFPGEFIRVGDFLNPDQMKLVKEGDVILPLVDGNRAYIGLFGNPEWGWLHWIVFSGNESYDSLTGIAVNENDDSPLKRSKALLAICFERD